MPDRARRATWVALLLIVTGLAAPILAWAGTTATADVFRQLPYVVSAGLAGLLLVGVGAAVVNAQVGRVLEARSRRDLEAATDATLSLLVALRDHPSDDRTQTGHR